ncbi:LCP family protein [Actinoplanes oblitus]|uniref:LCP family protein n=2 Tax=Actinoplanes oblitus TaxID=3040509 RepID=A0ABY8WTZ7_9ACTN|nr:LCP family protein [Actinoplanes oblitus]WIN00953.1 LCP family protein [Actinoplanes oblitus]
MVTSGVVLVGGNALIAKYTGAIDADGGLIGAPAEGATKAVAEDIKGPINILMAGIDPRDDKTAPLSDSIIVAHIPATMDQVYLFSIPRDLYVDIPAFPPTGFGGGKSKINAAMSYGSSVGNGKHDVKQGFQLLAKTVGQLTGIKDFQAGAIINFGGFKKIVEAMGGVTMTVDMVVKSEHLKPNGERRDRRPECADNTCAHPYIGEQKVYRPGTYHLKAWEALDYVRQRYGLPHSDYDRQRHQQQFIKAMAKQAMSKGVVTNPSKMLKILDAGGDALTFDGNGHSILDWGLALQGLNTDNMVSIKLPGGGVYDGGRYLGEGLGAGSDQFFEAVRNDRIPEFLLAHPEFVNRNS